MAVLFNTLQFQKSLVTHEFTSSQSEGLTEALGEALTDFTEGNLATKADIADVKVEIAGLKAELKTEMAENQAKLEANNAGLKAELKTEMAENQAKLETKIEGIKTEFNEKLSEAKFDMIKWLVGIALGILLSNFGMSLAIIKIFSS